MKLLSKCIGCNENIKIKSFATNRPDLERDLGEKITVSCKKCHRKQTVHPNEVRAVENPFMTLFGLAMGILITVLLWGMLGAIGTISMGIPAMIFASETKAVKTFNSYRL